MEEGKDPSLLDGKFEMRACVLTCAAPNIRMDTPL